MRNPGISPKKKKTVGDYIHLLSLPAGMLLLLVVVIDVCGRFFFNTSIDYALSLETLLLMVIAFTSLAATWKGGQFITVDALVNLFSERKRFALELGSLVISLLCTFVLLWYGLESVIRDFGGGARPSNMSTPLWFWKIFVPLGTAALLFEVLRSLVLKIRNRTKIKQEEL